MHDWGEVIGLFFIWSVFMGVIAIYAVRIGGMLYEQRLTQRAYRMHLALKRGREVREATAGRQARG